MNKKKIYLTGDISGLKHLISQKFGAVEVELMRRGHEVINPLNILPEDTTFLSVMKVLIPAMLECDEVHFLPDWRFGNTSIVEHDIASKIGMKIVYVEN